MLWVYSCLFGAAAALTAMDCYKKGLLLSGGACIARCPQGDFAGQYECYPCTGPYTIAYSDSTFTIAAPKYLQTLPTSTPLALGTFTITNPSSGTITVTVKANYATVTMTTVTGLTFISGATDPSQVPVSVLVFSGTAAMLSTAMSSLTYTPIQYFPSGLMTNSVDTVLISFSDGTNYAHIEMRVILGTAKDPSSCECTKKLNGLVCSGHGTCDWQNPGCTCPVFFSGSYCEKDSCRVCMLGGSSGCSVSTHSTCLCTASASGDLYTGDRCQYQKCPGMCNTNGTCDRNTGICTCFEGYYGHDCSQVRCINDCSGYGRCVAGTCNCYVGFFGPDCSGIKCPRDCGADGGCDFTTGKCKCSGTYADADCMFTTCPSSGGNICNSQGDCDYKTGLCSCYTGYSGVDCSFH